MPPTPTLTIDTAAVQAGTTRRRIMRLIHLRAIPTVEAGDAVLILQNEFTAWLAAGGMQSIKFTSRAAQRRRGAAYRAQHACQTGAI